MIPFDPPEEPDEVRAYRELHRDCRDFSERAHSDRLSEERADIFVKHDDRAAKPTIHPIINSFSFPSLTLPIV